MHARRADAQDLFLAGREAIVEAVLFDVDGQVWHLAVTPADDPAADLSRNHGRFLYFAPDEVVPVPAGRQPGSRREGNDDHQAGQGAALLAVVIAAIVQSVPDIKRYLELREM